MSSTRREKQREATSRAIKDTARALMARDGTAGLSIRAIAREMGLTPPALYRYFDSLDDLITALILDAFNALADALNDARDEAAAAGASYGQRLMAVLLRYRAWALEYAVDFQLIYGNPIPGYEAPSEITVPAAQRGFETLVGLIEGALRSGECVPRPPYAVVPSAFKEHLDLLREDGGYDTSTLALYYGVIGWPRVHGLIMLELFNHIQPVVGDVDAFYRQQMLDLCRAFGMDLGP